MRWTVDDAYLPTVVISRPATVGVVPLPALGSFVVILLIVGLAAGAVAVWTGIRGLQTNRIYVSAFSKQAVTGPAAKRISWVCIAVGITVLLGMYVLAEKL